MACTEDRVAAQHLNFEMSRMRERGIARVGLGDGAEGEGGDSRGQDTGGAREL